MNMLVASQPIEYPFTSRTYISLAIARGIAAAYGHTDLTGRHVALGLLREAENPAVVALQRAGVSLRALRQDLQAALPPEAHPEFGQILLPTTARERAIVEIAVSETVSRNGEYVGTEHLLLALVRDPDSPAGQVFARHGFTYETATHHLRSVFSAPNAME